MRLPTLFRPARPRSRGVYLLWTAAQSVVVWGVTLGVGPALLVALEHRAGIPGFRFTGQPVLAAVLFLACSALNLATGALLAVGGRGTPLPLACPRTLVLGGPYRYVRNPMAIAGIGQGVAVALWLGSWSVLGYAASGAVVWHVLVRPAEERDLASRFGAPYDAYRRSVPLWWPRRRPFVAVPCTRCGSEDDVQSFIIRSVPGPLAPEVEQATRDEEAALLAHLEAGDEDALRVMGITIVRPPTESALLCRRCASAKPLH